MTTASAPARRELQTVPPGPDREAVRPLLLIADEPAPLDGYLDSCDLYVYRDVDDGTALGVVAVADHGAGERELMNVAVEPSLVRQGIGQAMIAALLDDLRRRGVRRVTVGTGNSRLGNLGFYQKCGFRFSHVVRDFFVAGNGYPPDGENGLIDRDHVYLDYDLLKRDQ